MKQISNLIFPRRCPVCDRPVDPWGAYVCDSCKARLIYVKDPVCMKCGKGLHDPLQEYCYDCSMHAHSYDRGISVYRYDSIRQAVYRFKYGKRREYAEFLGREMADALRPVLDDWKPDALVPVPLHKKRFRQRGYNQAALLAEVIGRQLGLPVAGDWIIRCRNTRPQKLVDGQNRRTNLKNAFKIVQNDVKLKTIIIIDDVYTTGSTIDAVASLCREHGTERIYFAALSIGSGF